MNKNCHEEPENYQKTEDHSLDSESNLKLDMLTP